VLVHSAVLFELILLVSLFFVRLCELVWSALLVGLVRFGGWFGSFMGWFGSFMWVGLVLLMWLLIAFPWLLVGWF